VIEERFEAVHKEKQAEYERKLSVREQARKAGQNPRGRDPEAPGRNPEEKAQYNFTDPESRIMKMRNRSGFEQCYNAQAAVDTEGSYRPCPGIASPRSRMFKPAVDEHFPFTRPLSRYPWVAAVHAPQSTLHSPHHSPLSTPPLPISNFKFQLSAFPPFL